MTIRRQPEDFIVNERPRAAFLAALSFERSASARHAVYELTKQSLGTPEATGMFGRRIGVGGGRVDYAGLKDKHARTVQLVSVEPRDDGVPKELGESGWSARLLGWSPQAVSADAIEGNRFEIVVRELSASASTEMETRADLLRTGDSLLVMNYFGAQRFGSARHGGGFMAPRLIRGDFEGALRLAIGTPARKDTGKMRGFTRACAQRWGDWKSLAAELPKCPERRPIETLAAGGTFAEAFAALPNFTQQMAVEAYQSHLWNAMARRLAGSLSNGAVLRADDEFGEMVFPLAAAVPPLWREANLPVLGPKSVPVEPWAAVAADVLAEEGIQLEDLHIPGLRRPYFGEADRPLFAVADRFEMTPAAPDELGGKKRVKRTVRFELGRGAYATVVLRALGQ